MTDFFCPRCEREYDLTQEEYRRNRFCTGCGTKLQHHISDTVTGVGFGGTGRTSIIEDVEKGREIAENLYRQFTQKIGFFKGYEMPEYINPGAEDGSRELALYLTFVIAIDYQTNAENLWRRSREAFRRRPEMFSPEKIVSVNPDELEAFVRNLGARFPSNGGRAWREIARILITQFSGDPANLTPTPMTVKGLRNRLDQFPYLRGRKLSNFYMRVMYEKGYFKILDPQNIPVAPDIQVGRVTFFTGVLKQSGSFEVGSVGEEPVRTYIERVWSEAVKPLGIPAAYLDEALWTIGSRLCSSRSCVDCPVDPLCEKNFEVVLS